MPRFTIRALLQATIVVAIFTAAFKTGRDGGLFLALIGSATAVWFIHRNTGRLNLLGAAAIAVFLTWISSGFMSREYPNSNRSSCQNNLKQLGLALLNYEDKYKCLPPACTLDNDDKPLMSWRVQILPDIEEATLFSQYRQNEMWDSPTNSLRTRDAIEGFHCPSDFGRARQTNETSYVAIIGPGTAWTPGRPLRLAEMTDGTSNTILLVEMKNSGIAWAEPRDLDLENLPPGITTENLLESIAIHPGIVNVVFADGHVESIPTDIPWSDFHAMLTIAGGENVDPRKW
jgi:prepilin-type processing-associated H-X9-DG protein